MINEKDPQATSETLERLMEVVALVEEDMVDAVDVAISPTIIIHMDLAAEVVADSITTMATEVDQMETGMAPAALGVDLKVVTRQMARLEDTIIIITVLETKVQMHIPIIIMEGQVDAK